MNSPPPNSDRIYIETGAAILRRAISFMTRAQSEKLFAESVRVGEVARALNLQAWDEWLKSQARSRNAPDVPISGARAVLGVSVDASESEIQAAYRRLAAKHHPDREGGDTATMAALNAARDALIQRGAA